MNSPVLITRSSETVSGGRKIRLSKRWLVGETTLAIILVLMISLVSLLYLVHLNKTATKGYALKMLDQEHEELLQKNEVWNMRIAEAKAMRTILEAEVVRGMVEVEEMQFVEKWSQGEEV